MNRRVRTSLSKQIKMVSAVVVDISPWRRAPACVHGGRAGGLLTCGCVFAVWHWQFVSSSFVFPRERVKYPGCCPDLGEGLCHPRQVLRPAFVEERLQRSAVASQLRKEMLFSFLFTI